MKKGLIIILKVLLPIILYSQTNQFNIIDEFALKRMNRSYMGYDNNKIMIYDSMNNKVYSYDTLGVCFDSLAINKYKINGLDIYKDTLYILKNKVNSKKATIFKINYHNGEIYDSLVWFMGNETDYSEFLAVNKNSFVSYISAGWSSRLVQISQTGKIINSILSPGSGTPAGITCYGNKFYFITSLGANEKGNYYEYKINKDEINNIHTANIPIDYPRGVACISENSFFIYSNSKKKLYRVSINQSTNQIDSLVTTDKLWSIMNSWWMGTDPPEIRYLSSYIRFSGDTVIDYKHYKKILECTDTLKKDWNVKGYIREEDHRVYGRKPGDETEGLMYDFNVKLNDTVKITNPFEKSISLALERIDTLALKGNFIRRFTFIRVPYYTSSPDSFYWYEGIGSSQGIIHSAWDGTGRSTLLCFWEDNQLKYSNPDFNYCFNTTNLVVSTKKHWSTMTCQTNKENKDGPCESKYLRFAGDTVIDHKHYNRILKCSDTLRKNWQEVGYIREENRKVYARKPGDETEGLMYNFRAISPYYDTLLIRNPFIKRDSMKMAVISIGSILLENGYAVRKITLLNEEDSIEHWYEYIGSEYGVLGSGKSTEDGKQELLCFWNEEWEGEGPHYTHPQYDECFYPEETIDSLVSPTKQWSMLRCDGGTSSAPQNCHSQYIRFAGDSLIDGLYYKKIRVSGDSLQESWETAGFIREEDHRVYARKSGDATEGLMYDFDIQPGDTLAIRNPFLSVDSVSLSVVSIDTTGLIKGKVKRFALKHDGDSLEYWMEGIGSEYGVLSSGGNATTENSRLLCYWNKDTLRYTHPGYESCFQTVVSAGDPVHNRQEPVVVYPNPVSEAITFPGLQEHHTPVSIKLYDVQGRVVFTAVLNERHAVNLSRLSSGMYFFSLTANDHRIIQTGKIIKQ